MVNRPRDSCENSSCPICLEPGLSRIALKMVPRGDSLWPEKGAVLVEKGCDGWREGGGSVGVEEGGEVIGGE